MRRNRHRHVLALAQCSHYKLCQAMALFPSLFLSSFVPYILHVSVPTYIVMLVGCLASQQHACVSQGRICSDNCTCCHTEREVADQTFHLTKSQYTDTGPTSPSADPTMPGAWQGSHWSANLSHWYELTPKNPSASRIRTWDLPLLRRTP